MRTIAKSDLGIGLDLGGLEFPPVAQPDGDVAATGNNVVVGKNDAGRIDDHARTAAGNTVRDIRHAMKPLKNFRNLRVFEHIAEGRAVETEGNLLRVVVAVLGDRLRALRTPSPTVGLVVIVTTAGNTCSAAA